MGARPRSTFTRLLVAHAHTRDACGSAATAERHAKPDFLEAAPPRIQNQFRMSLHPPKHRRRATVEEDRTTQAPSHQHRCTCQKPIMWMDILPCGSHAAPARRPPEMARPRRRCSAARAHGGRETIAPFSHPFRTLLFALFPYPPLLFSLIFLILCRLGWPPDPLVSSKYDLIRLHLLPRPWGQL